MKRLFTVLIAAALFLCASFPQAAVLAEALPAESDHLSTGEIGVLCNPEFGSTYLEPSIEEFNAMGFAYGDSLDFAFDNGILLEDVPYFSGYYVPVGHLVLSAYLGYPHPTLARNFGTATWAEFGLNDNSRVTVTLNEKGKYIQVEELYSLTYSLDPADYDSVYAYTNFRELRGGRMKPRTLYRSCSPCDCAKNRARAAAASRICEEFGIRFVLNLCDPREKYEEYTSLEGFDSPYYDTLARNGDVLFTGLNADFHTESYTKTVCDALLTMAGHEGPCLIHCTEGKDRTGFVSILLLTLAEASPEDIITDYMISYQNFYGITRENNPRRYEAMLPDVDSYFEFLCGTDDWTGFSPEQLCRFTENYLRKGGLTDEQIGRIEAWIREDS